MLVVVIPGRYWRVLVAGVWPGGRWGDKEIGGDLMDVGCQQTHVEGGGIQGNRFGCEVNVT